MGSIRSVAVGVALVGLSACSGSAFTQGSPTGSDLGGAAATAGASSIGTGGSSMPSGAAGQGGKPMASSGSGSGGSSAGGELEPAAAGAGGELEPAAAMPCDRSQWKATASLTNDVASYALDGKPATRWTTNVPREPTQWFQVDFPEPTAVATLELHTELYPMDSPELVRVDVDGKPVSFKPTTPEPGVLVLELAGTPASRVRIIASDHGKPVPDFMDQLAWWSIYELEGTCR